VAELVVISVDEAEHVMRVLRRQLIVNPALYEILQRSQITDMQQYAKAEFAPAKLPGNAPLAAGMSARNARRLAKKRKRK
jgi:hypothetical protein